MPNIGCELGHRTGPTVYVPVLRSRQDGCEYLDFTCANTDERAAARAVLLKRLQQERPDEFVRMDRFEWAGSKPLLTRLLMKKYKPHLVARENPGVHDLTHRHY